MIIPILKTDGALTLVSIFAGLSALGTFLGSIADVLKTVSELNGTISSHF